jgi:hypothetical protein
MWIAPIGQTATQFPQATHFLGSIIIAHSVRNRVLLSAPRAVASAACSNGTIVEVKFATALGTEALHELSMLERWKKRKPEISITFGFKANI